MIFWKNTTFCIDISLVLGKGTQQSKPFFRSLTPSNRQWIKSWLPVVFFLDFSKAFDTVNHNILLSKLYHYGIRGITFNWFENYVHNRTQFVKIGNIQSSPETITCGVPQGATLGPLLFLLYINDLPNCSKNYPSIYLLMIRICFIQVIICISLSMS